MASDATTVHVKNISKDTTEGQVKDFFSFCGKISQLSLSQDGQTQTAKVSFEKPTAAKTAQLLDNTQLGPSLVQVSSPSSATSSADEPSSAETSAPAGDNVEQEDKPRARILAEYLASGYAISDKAIERAIALDKQHGLSTRFTAALRNFDEKYKATEKAQGLDTKYGVSEKAGAGWKGFHSYFEKALGTPTGQKVRAFYQDGQKQAIDVHTEARRLADLKSGKQSGGVGGGAADTPTPTPATASAPGAGSDGAADNNSQAATNDPTLIEKMNLQKVEGTERTKCNCAGAEGSCPCEPGKCACGDCHKNPDATPAKEGGLGGTTA